METGKNKLESYCFGQTKQEELSSSAHLLIESEVDQLSFSIIDQKANQCIGLCSFPINQSLGNSERREVIQSIMTSNDIINYPFSKRQLLVSSRECVFVPEEIFRKEEQDDYIRSSFESDYGGKVFSHAIPSLNNYLVYKIPEWLLSLVEDKLSGTIVSHSSSYLAEALYRSSIKNEEATVHVHFKRSFFELFIFNKGKMMFYNSFSFQTSEDIAYFIMYALKQWDMESNGLTVSGIFDADSDELYWLKKYAGEIEEFPVDNLLPYPAAIEKPGSYINLLNPSFCE